MSGDPNLKVSKNHFFCLSQVCTECNSTSCNTTEHLFNDVSSEVISQTESHSAIDKEDDNNKNIESSKYQEGFSFQSRGIHIVNLNIRHLEPKVDELKVLLPESKQVDVLGVCETFLNKSVDDKILHIDGYTFKRKDRDACTAIDTKNGGGIVVYIHVNINYTRRIDLETSDIESIWLEFKLKNSKSFLFCSVYRPPSSKSEWIDTFSLQIEKSLLLNNEIYIAGDLNIDFKDGNAANNKWKHVIETHDLSQHINTPTRVTAHSETIIDHVYASDSAHMIDISVPNIAVSDHYPSCLLVLQPTFILNVRSIFPFSIALSTNSMMIAFLMTSPNR